MKATGAKVISSATTVDEARWLEAEGCDAIIAQGYEAGGHRGTFLTDDISTQVGTMALVPQVVDAVTIPVIAAGGITDARGIVAALALGASAVQMGTAYLFCPEANIPPLYRAALKKAKDNGTVLTNVVSGRPARVLVNRIVRDIGPMSTLSRPSFLSLALSWPPCVPRPKRRDQPISPHSCLASPPLSAASSPAGEFDSATRCRSVGEIEDRLAARTTGGPET